MARKDVSAIVSASPAFVPPADGRVRVLSVTVDESRQWDEAMRAAGPNTPDHCNVWKVGDQYPSQLVLSTRKVVLVNFGKHMSSKDVLDWGEQHYFCPATPRVCFAIAEHHPNLNRDLCDNDFMAIASLVSCSFEGRRRVCCVWWYVSERLACLEWFGLDWNGRYWFAFAHE